MRRLLALLLWLAAASALLESMPSPLPASCPAWAVEYARFHQAHRGATGSRHLTVECPAGYRQGGLGDHLRGVMYALRVASKHRLARAPSSVLRKAAHMRSAGALRQLEGFAGRVGACSIGVGTVAPALTPHRASWTLRTLTGGRWWRPTRQSTRVQATSAMHA